MFFFSCRGVGLFVGLELVTDREQKTPATETAACVVKRYRIIAYSFVISTCLERVTAYNFHFFGKHCLRVFCDLTRCPLYDRLKEEDNIFVSTDGPWESVLKFKPPMCFSMEDAELVVQCIDRILTG